MPRSKHPRCNSGGKPPALHTLREAFGVRPACWRCWAAEAFASGSKPPALHTLRDQQRQGDRPREAFGVLIRDQAEANRTGSDGPGVEALGWNGGRLGRVLA